MADATSLVSANIQQTPAPFRRKPLTYLFSHHGALESNTITTEDDLFIFLLHHARKHTLKAMYPKAVADFADEVIGALMADRDLDDLNPHSPDAHVSE